MSTESIAESRRQIQVCNACRYCEGYCSVFPALQRERNFTDGNIIQLANLCHNCRGCYYACQYAEPHEFKINIPQTLANVRQQSWESFIGPQRLAIAFQHSGVTIALLLLAMVTAMFLLIGSLPSGTGPGFYAWMSHAVMVTIFLPAFFLPLVVTAIGLRRYWKTVGGTPVRWSHLHAALVQAATLRNLSGGRDQGCNFEAGDRFTRRRRNFHQATMWGFLLCFASTSVATIMHYAFGMVAPYGLLSLPKLLGIPGGILLVAGCLGLIWLKLKADPELGATTVWSGEMAFILLLGLTGLTGLALFAATGTSLVSGLLAVHLGCVLSLFLLLPYSKMVHGFFRLAALVREAQQQT
ncbi:MAG: tricarballylate utilization 4Fe-4S protein TcuB [Granulosicoccus sp.]|nr:tricarballylate utilization 4Fe-4S protein TcuB [Granulosicoccus sp.]